MGKNNKLKINMIIQIIENDKIISEVDETTIPSELLYIKVGERVLQVVKTHLEDEIAQIYVMPQREI